ncbi:DUF935 domain-containing protein, partial [Chromobacterium piscinae]
LLDSLEAMVQDAVAVIPDDSSVEIKEAANGANNADVYERLLHFCRSEVSIALLGQNQTTEANSNRASAQAGLEVTRDIRDGDKEVVEEALNQLVRWVCELNFNDGDRPLFQMWEQEQVDEVQASRDEKLTRAGATFTPAYFKRAYKLQDGDLVETAKSETSAEFAEADEEAPDQDALDAALNALSADDLQADAAAMLQPLFARIQAGAQADELLGNLAELYPDMDASGLQERLARAVFVAKVWGRLHG